MKLIDKLILVKEFQVIHPNTHVCGSIGLFLHGIVINRDMSNSDIDMVSESYQPNPENTTQHSPHSSDFDLSVILNGSRIDLRIMRQPFHRITYDGIEYNVSTIENILFYKCKYAIEGSSKHINDLHAIAGKARLPIINQVTDDLPF